MSKRMEATFQVRCTDVELAAWKRLAASKGFPLAAYVRELLTAMQGAADGGS